MTTKAQRCDAAIRTLEETIHELKGLKTHTSHWVRLQQSLAKANHQIQPLINESHKEWDSVLKEMKQ